MAEQASETVEAGGLSVDELHDIWYYLQLTRQVETVLTHLYRQNKVIGGLYRSLGQEGSAVASAYALRRRRDGTGDVIAPAIRNLGSLFVMGARPADVMRQYMARGDSPTRGREQNVHFTDYDRGWIGLISHLGVMIEVMAGVAMSFRLRGEDRVALTWTGDGATSTGAFHEGFNLAAVQRAPLVVIVENNCYAYSTPISKQTACASFVDKAPGYGVHGASCDGNDVVAVYAMTRQAVDRARSGAGASLLEVMTYRRLGHAEHDQQGYVPAGELEAWAERDPIDRFERVLLQEGLSTAARLEEIRAQVAAEVDAARAEAEASPLPPAEEALEPVTGDGAPAAPWTRRDPADPKEA
jgi:TPP-dependent pyruvate/acetoin dehydrogenase alpha subunit